MEKNHYAKLLISRTFHDLIYLHMRDRLDKFAAGVESSGTVGGDDDVIFYMKLGFPLEFACCRIDEFRNTYLEGRTDIKVEVPGRGPSIVPPFSDLNRYDDWPSFSTIMFEYTKLNRCVPLERTTPKKIKHAIASGYVFSEDREKMTYDMNSPLEFRNTPWKEYSQIRHTIITHITDFFFDYMSYCIRCYCKKHPDSLDQMASRYKYGLNSVKTAFRLVRTAYPAFADLDSFAAGNTVNIPRLFMRVFRRYDSKLNSLRIFKDDRLNDCYGGLFSYPVFLLPYSVTTWKRGQGFKQEWMYFDRFIEEAQNILADPYPAKNCLAEYPGLQYLRDTDELCIYDLWRRSSVDLSFLEKDWYRRNPETAEGWAFLRFLGIHYRLLTRREAMVDYIMEMWSSLEYDGYSDEYLRRTAFVRRTCWGYVKEIDLTRLDRITQKLSWEREQELHKSVDFRLRAKIRKWNREADRRISLEQRKKCPDAGSTFISFWAHNCNTYERPRVIRFTRNGKGYEYIYV